MCRKLEISIKTIIMRSDFEEAMKNLTSFIPVKDEDMLMKVVKAEWRMRKRKFGYGLRPGTAKSSRSTSGTFRSLKSARAG